MTGSTTRAAGFLAAAAAVIGAWSELLGGPVRWLWAVAFAAAAMLAWERVRKPVAAAVLLVWPVAAMPAAGIAVGDLWPSRWLLLMEGLGEGFNRLVVFDPTSAMGDPWLAAGWLLLVGALWLGATAVTLTSLRSPVRALGALILVLLPWVVAVVIRETDQVSWQGAAILLAVLLWFAPSRTAAARPLVALGVGAAVLATTAAQLFGPRMQWFVLDEMVGRQPQFRTLDTAQTYGSLQGRRTGATMLEITAPQPALWRMQVLDRFGWRGWELGGGVDRPDLPEPMSHPVEIGVQVRGLRNDLVVSPGQIRQVQVGGRRASPAWGEAFRIIPRPRAGDTYRVRASMVTADAATLRAAPAATDPRLDRYTYLAGRWGGAYMHGRLGEYGLPPQVSEPARRFLPYGRYGELTNLVLGLTAGAATQYDVVERVQRFLTKTGGFRYSTDVEETSRIPLQEFLLDTKVGYCQHFAGAAALLLRMAGVPTRVVAGFATGKEQGGRYVVRDLDAHAWIEVYFETVGWVPFNPTPAAAEATVDPAVDPLAPAAARDGGRATGVTSVLALSLLLAAGPAMAVRLTRRRRGARGSAEALLEALARAAGGQVTPTTTWRELSTELARIGPRVAAIADELERARFAPKNAPPPRRPRIRILKAAATDVLMAAPPARRLAGSWPRLRHGSSQRF